MSDVELYEQALRLHTELWYAVQLTARVQDDSVFPITTREKLIDALLAREISLKAKSNLKLEGMTLSSTEASKMFPLRYLPVANKTDLLVKLYSAFMNLKQLVQLEASAKRLRRFASEEVNTNV